MVGGAAGGFGTTQEDNTRRIVAIKDTQTGGDFTLEMTLEATGEYVGKLWTVSNYAPDAQYWSKSYKVSSGEIRPRNQATRLWRRIA